MIDNFNQIEIVAEMFLLYMFDKCTTLKEMVVQLYKPCAYYVSFGTTAILETYRTQDTLFMVIISCSPLYLSHHEFV